VDRPHLHRIRERARSPSPSVYRDSRLADVQEDHEDWYSDDEKSLSDSDGESISGFPSDTVSPRTSDVHIFDEKATLVEAVDASVLQACPGREVFNVISSNFSKYLGEPVSIRKPRGQMVHEPGVTADTKKHQVLFRWM
jgi:hypothetical protein